MLTQSRCAFALSIPLTLYLGTNVNSESLPLGTPIGAYEGELIKSSMIFLYFSSENSFGGFYLKRSYSLINLALCPCFSGIGSAIMFLTRWPNSSKLYLSAYDSYIFYRSCRAVFTASYLTSRTASNYSKCFGWSSREIYLRRPLSELEIEN